MEDDIDDVEEDEVMKEDEDDNDEEEEDEADKPSAAKPKKRRKPRSVLTGRGVTLGMLLEDGVMEPGEKCLSIDYLVSTSSLHVYIMSHLYYMNTTSEKGLELQCRSELSELRRCVLEAAKMHTLYMYVLYTVG